MIILCSSPAPIVESHVAGLQARFKHVYSITTIVSPACNSVGDALRRLDEEDCIKSDFVLVTGAARPLSQDGRASEPTYDYDVLFPIILL